MCKTELISYALDEGKSQVDSEQMFFVNYSTMNVDNVITEKVTR